MTDSHKPIVVSDKSFVYFDSAFPYVASDNSRKMIVQPKRLVTDRKEIFHQNNSEYLVQRMKRKPDGRNLVSHFQVIDLDDYNNLCSINGHDTLGQNDFDNKAASTKKFLDSGEKLNDLISGKPDAFAQAYGNGVKSTLDRNDILAFSSSLVPDKDYQGSSFVRTAPQSVSKVGKIVDLDHQKIVLNVSAQQNGSKNNKNKEVITMAASKKFQQPEMVGKDKELYVQSAFAQRLPAHEIKSGPNAGQKVDAKDMVNVTFRQRRDVDPKDPNAGKYTANRTYKYQKSADGKGNVPVVSHTQFISLDSFQKIQKAAGVKPVTKKFYNEQIKAHDNQVAGRNHQNYDPKMEAPKPLALGDDNVAFVSNVFSDTRNRGNALVNVGKIYEAGVDPADRKDAIRPSTKPFDYKVEKALNAEHNNEVAAKNEAKIAARKAEFDKANNVRPFENAKTNKSAKAKVDEGMQM